MELLFIGAAMLAAYVLSRSSGNAAAQEYIQGPVAKYAPPATWPGAKTQVPPGAPGKYFSWKELTRSRTADRFGLDNTPTPEAASRLILLTQNLLDRFREYLDTEIVVTNAYRSKEVNDLVPGSADDSQHMRGEGVDILVPGMSARQVVVALLESGLPFDQAIWYDLARGGHVHLSWTASRPNRRQTLHAPAGTDAEVPWRP